MQITEMLGNIFEVTMAMQSMTESVLTNIKRSNIKLSHMIEINNELRKKGRTTASELIVPLPGETKESFVEGLNNVINSNVSRVVIYTLMMLHGTKFKQPDYRKQFGYSAKFRIVPLNFGEYDGKDSMAEALLLKDNGAISIISTTRGIGETSNINYLKNPA